MIVESVESARRCAAMEAGTMVKENPKSQRSALSRSSSVALSGTGVAVSESPAEEIVSYGSEDSTLLFCMSVAEAGLEEGEFCNIPMVERANSSVLVKEDDAMVLASFEQQSATVSAASRSISMPSSFCLPPRCWRAGT